MTISDSKSAWTPDTESYSTDGPQCPHCGFTYTPDEPHYFDESNYTDEQCQECGTKFKVEVFHSVSWSCEVVSVGEHQTKEER